MGNPLLVGATLPVEGVANGTPVPVSSAGLPSALGANGGLVVEQVGEPAAPTDNTFLASGARTTTQTQADQTNTANFKGIRVVVDVTTPGTGSITVAIQAKDSVSGKYVTMLTSAAITTTTTNTYLVFPGAANTANVSANDRLPRVWRLLVTHNNANSITYSVGYMLLP